MNMAQYHRRRDELSVLGGCVLWGAKVVIPPQCRQELLHELHLAYPGFSRMKSLARRYVWWPAMDRELEEMVQKCDTCQLYKNYHPLLHYIQGVAGKAVDSLPHRLCWTISRCNVPCIIAWIAGNFGFR